MAITSTVGKASDTIVWVGYTTLYQSTVIEHLAYVRAILDTLTADEAVRAATGDEMYCTTTPVPPGMSAATADLIEAWVLEDQDAARQLVLQVDASG